MSGNVHQSDKTKLKATVDVAADQAIEVTQADASKLKGTVTQLAKDRTVTGTVTCIQSSGHLHKVEASQDPFVEYQVSQGTAANLKATVTQLAKDRTVTNATAANLKAEVEIAAAQSVIALQSIATQLKAEVTQLAKDRTVTNATAANLKCEPTQTTAANLKATTYEAQQLIPFSYDYIALSYTGVNLTSVVYKTGGSGGSTVATLTLAYTDSRLDSITRT